ncbi:hypothetical protein KAFR_0F00420 [Kazachstania africana CBS 2517]|uniref:Mid2 domain-containing protein n=1 Tax=Kazachstania africana (strain ATCC 22294 / BCRC 22015 / CBS 2517 / CECT 1963 / NBRC 1671 / NRRL Y-8276) TaxID=1071382 RepID=H2AW89_KAZAF|nr:hypothetical protein KAFR_0F00420 [Kazachstania africana CBS 2517]CCF58639.1 hypothetical protein KAFR_0F00420 [Kazachstania africana CBS 2517]
MNKKFLLTLFYYYCSPIAAAEPSRNIYYNPDDVSFENIVTSTIAESTLRSASTASILKNSVSYGPQDTFNNDAILSATYPSLVVENSSSANLSSHASTSAVEPISNNNFSVTATYSINNNASKMSLQNEAGTASSYLSSSTSQGLDHGLPKLNTTLVVSTGKLRGSSLLPHNHLTSSKFTSSVSFSYVMPTKSSLAKSSSSSTSSLLSSSTLLSYVSYTVSMANEKDYLIYTQVYIFTDETTSFTSGLPTTITLPKSSVESGEVPTTHIAATIITTPVSVYKAWEAKNNEQQTKATRRHNLVIGCCVGCICGSLLIIGVFCLAFYMKRSKKNEIMDQEESIIDPFQGEFDYDEGNKESSPSERKEHALSDENNTIDNWSSGDGFNSVTSSTRSSLSSYRDTDHDKINFDSLLREVI